MGIAWLYSAENDIETHHILTAELQLIEGV
jgi:hypothetical protein